MCFLKYQNIEKIPAASTKNTAASHPLVNDLTNTPPANPPTMAMRILMCLSYQECSVYLQVVWSEAGVFINASEHARTNFFSVTMQLCKFSEERRVLSRHRP